MTCRLVVPDHPSPEHRDAIAAPLLAFNAAAGYPSDPEPVAILLTGEDGRTVGGLWGKTSYGWLFVDLLVVPEAARGRGLGGDLLARAEAIAVARGCTGAWLTTFAFQARRFYEAQGYEHFGALDRSPAANVRHFLRKTLA